MEENGTGYRKPPKDHQFKKGQSGNPRGRPRKVPDPIRIDEAEIIRRLDAEIVQVNGKPMMRRMAEIRTIREVARTSRSPRAARLLEKLRKDVSSSFGGGTVYMPDSFFEGD